MNIIKTEDSISYIPKDTFKTCLLDGRTDKFIIDCYPVRKDGAYYLDKFQNYLKDNYQIGLKEYCLDVLKVVWPRCPISNEEVGFKISGKGMIFSRFKKGKVNKEHCPKFAEACEKASLGRRGEGNPMFGKKAWNKGLSSEDERVKKVANAITGIKRSEETREKQRQKRKSHPLKARHTSPHSKETKNKIRINTAKMWGSGAFNRVTSIHKKVREFLESLDLKCKWVEEYQVWYFSLDFAFPDSKIGIECQGTYFHIDPRIYPNGPIDAIQRRNFGRDNAKKKIVCDREGWTIIELWETEIKDGSFQDILMLKLKELKLI
jgi:hypothetical protein